MNLKIVEYFEILPDFVLWYNQMYVKHDNLNITVQFNKVTIKGRTVSYINVEGYFVKEEKEV